MLWARSGGVAETAAFASRTSGFASRRLVVEFVPQEGRTYAFNVLLEFSRPQLKVSGFEPTFYKSHLAENVVFIAQLTYALAIRLSHHRLRDLQETAAALWPRAATFIGAPPLPHVVQRP